ncbi:hypothetical protein PPERSA_06931 [Pseudocohnilembus persalinus]|uniref:Serine carboxypeptidase S28 family protein n=1 Tax=Pseudocohnilembus persalinus TaxID=266149 RepID=A0A0V0QYL2_PSEPJ|nr:hypothetical protein PPERSA_06931 [Pseudocohnilembus persalinus]|eukprot:KRX07316.1 hypothetical protein PPERSA_06931 [Pseudocohnilembus persalinus]
MKFNQLFVFALISLLFLVQANIITQNLKNSEPIQGQHEQTFDFQILDHFTGGPQTYWSQRWWAFPDYFNNKTGPLFLYICGESTCKGLPSSRTFTKVLAEKYNGIVITLEHRFYGASQPFGQNDESYSTENLKYLTHEQGLEDLAIFLQWIKDNKYYGVQENTPVITVGGSYPGAMSAWFRYKYRHLTIGGYASSAVVHAIEDFQDYDMQVGISAGYSGQYCTEDIKQINDYVTRQLRNEETAQALKTKFRAQNLGDDEFLEFFADIYSGLVQYGSAQKMCSNLQDKSIAQQLNYLATQSSDPDSYTVSYMQDTKYNINRNARQWTYQTCTAFGWFQTANKANPFRSTKVDLDYFEQKCLDIFGDDYIPNVPQTNLIMGSTDLRVPNLIFTNGLEDPWQWASIMDDVGSMNAYVAMCYTCAHCCDLSTPTESQPVELTYVQDEVQATIGTWIEQYWAEEKGEDFVQQNFKKPERNQDQEFLQRLSDLEQQYEKSIKDIFGKYIKVF